MSHPFGPATTFRGINHRVWAAVVLLLVFYATVALTAATQKGLSFDETEELAVGYNIWLNHDFRMETANGDLMKRWATLPYLFTRPNFPDTQDQAWRDGHSYILGYEFFFQKGNLPELLLLQGRAMAVLLGVATGLLIFLCSREIFGQLGGLLSLTIFVYSPHMLAFGGIVSTEMPTCLTLLGATWCVWRLLHRVSWGRLLGCLAFFALLLLAKPSGLVIFPITAVLLVLKIYSHHPLEWRLGRPRLIKSRKAQTGIFMGIMVLHGFVGWLSIWAHYDFRYSASPQPNDAGILVRLPDNPDPIEPSVVDFLAWSRRTHFLPEGFLVGIQRIASKNDERQSFMNGQWRLGGTPSFFPYTLLAKTPPALFVLLLLGCIVWWWCSRKSFTPPPDPHALGPAAMPRLYAAAPYLTMIVVYFAVAASQNLNIGHRHILPLYPAFYVLAGSAALIWSVRPFWIQSLAIVPLFWLVAESSRLYPNYLAYFSPLVGGPAHGYQHLVDSSLDWGMNLPGLKSWLDQHNPGNRTPFYFSYFGTDSPDYYDIKSKRLPGFVDWRPMEVYPYSPGIYAISATLYESVYTPYFGPWNKAYENIYQVRLHNILLYQQAEGNPSQMAALLAEHPQKFWDGEYSDFEKLRFCRLCAWLRHHHPPDDNIGYSILIWRLNFTELRDALFGPPAELNELPVQDEG